MKSTRIVAVWIVVLLVAPAWAEECGTVRWPVKIGTDADAKDIVLNKAYRATINGLSRKKVPEQRPKTARVKPTELTLYEVTATLTDYKLSNDDQDYHIVLEDSAGRTMIAEIPDPDCVRRRGPLAPYVKRARQQFDAEYSPTGSFKTANRRVKVLGIGFYDHIHGQRGVAPNGIELHPLLNIEFLD